MTASYRQCTRCIMDTGDDSAITFDSAGVCSYCHTWDRRAASFIRLGEEGKKELAEIVEKIKRGGEGKAYDCVIGVSGGVDSTYAAYQAKKLGLRALAVHFDNGWDSELSVNNIENIVRRLGFDLYTYVVDWEEFKDLQLAYLKASVLDLEFPTDHGIVAAMYHVARKHGIRYILTGYNIATEGLLPIHWRWSKMDLLNLLAIHKRYGTRPLRTYPTLGFWRLLFFQTIAKIEVVQPLNYFPYDRENAKKIICEQLGWRDYGGKHRESVFTRFYQGYILPHKFGIDKRRAHLSSMICSGQITRERALEEVKKPVYEEEQLKTDCEFVVKKFGLTREEFDAFMQLPVRSHLQFPSYVTRHYRYHQGLFEVLRPFSSLWRKIRKVPPRIEY